MSCKKNKFVLVVFVVYGCLCVIFWYVLEFFFLIVKNFMIVEIWYRDEVKGNLNLYRKWVLVGDCI